MASRGSRLPLHRAIRQHGTEFFKVSALVRTPPWCVYAAEMAEIRRRNTLWPDGLNVPSGSRAFRPPCDFPS